MKNSRNPFITSGYISPEYFCDRALEQKRLIQETTGGSNIALISTRRMGKTGLIQHCFQDPSIQQGYYTFFIDIYATKSLRDFVFALSKEILETLKPQGKKAWQLFWESARSLQAGISFDMDGSPSFKLGLGDIKSSSTTLDELFEYLEKADKPCLVAIDEFQQIANYSEDNVEATLRTYVQRCTNARFIFSGSQHHTMSAMFLSASRPFYQSVSMMHLESIPMDKYTSFASGHFRAAGKDLDPAVIEVIYHRFDGITWYLQKLMQVLYERTPEGGKCEVSMLEEAVENILESFKYTYPEILFRMPEKQKELLIAIAKEGTISSVHASGFIKKHNLASASSVQAAMKGLLEKDFVTRELDVYRVYDRFFRIWLLKEY